MAVKRNRRWHELKRWRREDYTAPEGKPLPRPQARQDDAGELDWPSPLPVWVDARGVRQGGVDGYGWQRLSDWRDY